MRKVVHLTKIQDLVEQESIFVVSHREARDSRRQLHPVVVPSDEERAIKTMVEVTDKRTRTTPLGQAGRIGRYISFN